MSDEQQPDEIQQQRFRFIKYMEGNSGGAAAPEVSGAPIKASASFDDSGMTARETSMVRAWQAALEGANHGR